MSFYTYGEAVKLIEDFNTNHCGGAKTSSSSITDYAAYIEGECTVIHAEFAEIKVSINYYRDYPNVPYFMSKSEDDNQKRIHSIEFYIHPEHKDAEYRRYYAEDEEVMDAIYPLMLKELDRAKAAFKAEREEQNAADKEKRHKEFLRLKQEFEPETVQEK